MEVKNHKLVGDNVSFDPTTKVSGQHAKGDLDTIIVHYTAGNNADVAVKTLKNPKVQASAHMVVSREGKVVQLADLNVITWHAGVSEYTFPDKKRTTFNKHSIGIEIANDGYLKKVEDKYFNAYNKEIAAEFAFFGKHRNPVTKSQYWHSYTDVQIKAVFDVCAAIIKEYPSVKYILGHEEIAPGRKTDPGPAFPLDELRKQMGVWIPGTAAIAASVAPPVVEKVALGTVGVATGKINFRSGPGADYDKVAEAVEKDEKVLILKKSGEWYEVLQDITGWVAKEYISQDNTDENYDGFVDADVLNIRAEPNGEKIANPLTRGQKVNIIKQDEGWMQIETQVKGWVAAKYVNLT